MNEIVQELNNEVCPIHEKHPRCKATAAGLEINACCKPFRETLENNLREINKRS